MNESEIQAAGFGAFPRLLASRFCDVVVLRGLVLESFVEFHGSKFPNVTEFLEQLGVPHRLPWSLIFFVA